MFFFFKQKTAYEISACLVGSEMCIRDSPYAVWLQGWASPSVSVMRGPLHGRSDRSRPHRPAVPSARCDCACQEPGLVIWRQRVGRQRLRDHRQGGLHGVTNLASAWLPAWPAWRSPRCWCGRLCSCSWPCAVGLRSAVLRRAWPRCCGARLRRMTGCSCSDSRLISFNHALYMKSVISYV